MEWLRKMRTFTVIILLFGLQARADGKPWYQRILNVCSAVLSGEKERKTLRELVSSEEIKKSDCMTEMIPLPAPVVNSCRSAINERAVPDNFVPLANSDDDGYFTGAMREYMPEFEVHYTRSPNWRSRFEFNPPTSVEDFRVDFVQRIRVQYPAALKRKMPAGEMSSKRAILDFYLKKRFGRHYYASDNLFEDSGLFHLHEKVPSSITDPDEKKRWIRANTIRSFWVWHANEEEAEERTNQYLKLGKLIDFFAQRVSFDKKPLIKTYIRYDNTEAIKLGIIELNPTVGDRISVIQTGLDLLDSKTLAITQERTIKDIYAWNPARSDEEKKTYLDAAQTILGVYPSIEEAQARILAVEEFYRQIRPYVMKYKDEMRLEKWLGIDMKHRGGEYPSYYRTGLMYRHGHDIIFSPSTQTFVPIELF